MSQNVKKELNLPESELAGDLGTIAIRVVVLSKSHSSTSNNEEKLPADWDDNDEVSYELGKKPTSTFLEDPKRGKQCCVFLINGQRQHTWDNHFIQKELEFKYLRNRMIVIVDCDGLKPKTIGHLMQGSRNGFYEGEHYDALAIRVIHALKGDPEIQKLQEEAEDEITSLKAGDEAVKTALDELIDAHHNQGPNHPKGAFQEGKNEGNNAGKGEEFKEVILVDDDLKKENSSYPVLQMTPDQSSIRLKPNEPSRYKVYTNPEWSWKDLDDLKLSFSPPIPELKIKRKSQLGFEDVELEFIEPEEFDHDQYPIESNLMFFGKFKEIEEPRIIEKRIVVMPAKKKPKPNPTPKPILKEMPTFIKVTSRQPIRLSINGPDVHVRLKWDGKNDLVNIEPPIWVINVTCDSPSVIPKFSWTKPVDGRFEVVIQDAKGLHMGDQLTFKVEAIGINESFMTSFTVDIVEPPGPRKKSIKLPGGFERKSPYNLIYIEKKDWDENETCWGNSWSATDAGSFEPPTSKAPLQIFINEDMALLENYRDKLVAKKLLENTIKARVNKYTAHVAFHLYQMSEEKKEKASNENESEDSLTDSQMGEEINRVAQTLIKLMEV